jgi:hypothetical protein
MVYVTFAIVKPLVMVDQQGTGQGKDGNGTTPKRRSMGRTM